MFLFKKIMLLCISHTIKISNGFHLALLRLSISGSRVIWFICWHFLIDSHITEKNIIIQWSLKTLLSQCSNNIYIVHLLLELHPTQQLEMNCNANFTRTGGSLNEAINQFFNPIISVVARTDACERQEVVHKRCSVSRWRKTRQFASD